MVMKQRLVNDAGDEDTGDITDHMSAIRVGGKLVQFMECDTASSGAIYKRGVSANTLTPVSTCSSIVDGTRFRKESVCEDYIENKTGYFVYDSVTSTKTGMTSLGDSQDNLYTISGYTIHPNMLGDEKGSHNGQGSNFPQNNKPGKKGGSPDWNKMGFNTLKYFKKRLPILTWIKDYNLSMLISDAIAGITVGLTVIPQGIAYAGVANLDAQYGLYSAFMGCFLYCIFGSSKDVTIGPTAIMALMTQIHAQYGPDYAVLLAFLSGLVIFSFGILQLGFMIDFISVPVIAGFTSAAAITIASGQVKSLLGLEIEHKSHLHLGIVDGWIDVFSYIGTTKWEDAVLGLVCSVILLSLRQLNRTSWFKTSENPAPGIQTWFNKLPAGAQNIVNKSVWFICTARNAVIVVICALIAGFSDPGCLDVIDAKKANETANGTCLWSLTGRIQEGLPPLRPPPFSTMEDGEYKGFGAMCSTLGSAIIVIPLIAILESVAIAKAFAGGKPVDASQEMIALGLCNVFGSFVLSMPTTGSFSRTAVNSASGVRSPFGGVFTGGLVILCLAFLIPFCAFIPKATLAAVIITAVIFSVEYEVVMPMWKSKRMDLVPAFLCFFVCILYELEFGILAGVAIQVVFILYHTARPGIQVQVKQVGGCGQEYLYIIPDQGIVFPSVSYVRNLINKAGVRQASDRIPVVIDCSKINSADFTAAKGFKAMLADFKARNTEVYWLDPSPNVAHVLKAIAQNAFKPIYGELEMLESGIVGSNSGGGGDSVNGNPNGSTSTSQPASLTVATAPLLNETQQSNTSVKT